MERENYIKSERVGLWAALKELFGAGESTQNITKAEEDEIKKLYNETKNLKQLEQEVAGETYSKKKNSKFGSSLKVEAEKVTLNTEAKSKEKEDDELSR